MYTYIYLMLFISELYLESKGKKGQKLNCSHYIPHSLDDSLAVSVVVVVLVVVAT